jgi:putative hydroxymethylpyrimidine transport system permease protein
VPNKSLTRFFKLQKNYSALKNIVLYFIVIFCCLFLIEYLLKIFEVENYLFPLPSATFKALIYDSKILFENFKFTIVEWLIGLALSVFFGIFLAVICFQFKVAKKIIEPLLLVSQSIPYLTFAPLLLLWFGLGKTPKVILIVLTCAFPIALMGLQSLEKVKKEYSLLEKILKLKISQRYFHIYFKGSLSGFFGGLKISVSYAFVSAVLSELIGSEAGLGVYLLRAQTSYRVDKVMACVLVIVVFSLLSTWIVDFLQKKVVFWEGKENFEK